MKAFLKKWADIFSNFKLLARVMICLASAAIVVSVGGFVAFQFSRGVDSVNNVSICAFGAIEEGRQLIGMFFFLFLAACLVIGIVIAYQSKDYAFPKTKMSPNKTLPVLCVVNGGLCLVNAIFCILAIVIDVPKVAEGEKGYVAPTEIAWAWYLIAAFFILACLAHLVMLLPALKSHYYMPKFEQQEKK